MGLLGPSKSELADRIEELEEQLADAEQGLSHDISETKEQANRAENKVHALRDVVDALNEFDHEEAGELGRKYNVVNTLDEPKIVWKATRNKLAKLLLPEGTTVVHPGKGASFSDKDKLRSDQAIVLGFEEVVEEEKFPNMRISDMHEVAADETALDNQDCSRKRSDFEYNVGEKVTPNNRFNRDTTVCCAGGIHFFRTKEEALDWYQD